MMELIDFSINTPIGTLSLVETEASPRTPGVYRISFYQESGALCVIQVFSQKRKKSGTVRHHSLAKPHMLLGLLLSIALPSI